MPTDYFLIGAGGHGKVVYEALILSHPQASVCVWDDDPEIADCTFLDVRICVPVNWSKLTGVGHVAIGNSSLRKSLFYKLVSHGKQIVTVIHPNAIISKWASIEEGSFIAAKAIVGPDTSLGAGIIINHGAVVDHDCKIGAFSHIAPNATLGGG